MKTIRILCVLLLGTLAAYAQGDATREITFLEANGLCTGAPIDATVEHSEYVLKYSSWVNFKLTIGDIVRKITFRGYNPGKEQTRHIKVWMTSEINERNYKLIYNDDYTIPHGGTAEERIPLLEFDLKDPYIINDSWLYLKVECTGEAMDTPLFFEYSIFSEWEKIPVVTFTVALESKTLSGTVRNEKGEPVAGAHLLLTGGRYSSFETEADGQGHYEVKLPVDQTYLPTVSAPGCITYFGEYGHDKVQTAVKFSDKENLVRDFLLYSSVSYKKGQRATIILPVNPNPEWGQYYRLAKRKENFIIFNRESVPQANVPYVIFPNMDFELNVGDYDLSQEAGSIEIPAPDGYNSPSKWCVFIGSYQNKDVSSTYTDEEIHFLDDTPDCDDSHWDFWRGRIGGCRAFLRIMTPFPEEVQFVYQNNSEVTGIVEATTTHEASTKYYDLLGRQLQSKPEKGLYIKDGKKILVR